MGEVFRGDRGDGGFSQQAAVKIVRAGMASEGVVARSLAVARLLFPEGAPARAKDEADLRRARERRLRR